MVVLLGRCCCQVVFREGGMPLACLNGRRRNVADWRAQCLEQLMTSRRRGQVGYSLARTAHDVTNIFSDPTAWAAVAPPPPPRMW